MTARILSIVIFILTMASCSEQVPEIINIKLTQKQESINSIKKKIDLAKTIYKKYSISIRLDSSVPLTLKTPDKDLEKLSLKLDDILNALESEKYKLVFDFLTNRLSGREANQHITLTITTKPTSYLPLSQLFYLNVNEKNASSFLEKILEIQELITTENKDLIKFESFILPMNWSAAKIFMQDLTRTNISFTSSPGNPAFSSDGRSLFVSLSHDFSQEETLQVQAGHKNLREINQKWLCNNLNLKLNMIFQKLPPILNLDNLMDEINASQYRICEILENSLFSSKNWLIHIVDLNFNHISSTNLNNHIYIDIDTNFQDTTLLEVIESIVPKTPPLFDDLYSRQ